MFEKDKISASQMMFAMNVTGGIILFLAMCSPYDFDQLPIFTGLILFLSLF